MSHSPHHRRHAARPRLESLEGRVVPVAFGTPWPDPTHLSLSFVPDGTRIAGHASVLQKSMNAVLPTAVWQQDILRAFQTWAAQANINIAVVPDGGQPFGTVGPTQHDPRFGDIRVGAQPMGADALSVSIPFDPALSGTWSGDVLFNSTVRFDGKTADLFAVALHEAGHVLGLGESTDRASAMSADFNHIVTLSASDIQAIQSLYGKRAPEPYAGTGGNNSTATATPIPVPSENSGATPLVVFSDLTTSLGTDVFSFQPPEEYTGSGTIRVQSAGRSLLEPRVTLLDSQGNVLATAEARSGFGDVVTLSLPALDPLSHYYVRVEAASGDVFGIGSYGVAVQFDSLSKVTPSALATVLAGPYESLSADDLANLLLRPGTTLVNHKGSSDDTLDTATPLTSDDGYQPGDHYHTLGSFAAPSDVNIYRIQAPNVPPGQPLVLTATLRTLNGLGQPPSATLIDATGAVVPSQVLANGQGTYVLQSAAVRAGRLYYLRIASTPNTAAGNYAVEINFGHTLAPLDTFATGALKQGRTFREYTLYIGRTQLMQLLLSSQAIGQASPGTRVTLTLTDSHGKFVTRLDTALGELRSNPALLLVPGKYRLRISASSSSGSIPALSFKLRGDTLSDPIGPTLHDPTLKPIYRSPSAPNLITYPGGVTTKQPYLIVAVPYQPTPALKRAKH